MLKEKKKEGGATSKKKEKKKGGHQRTCAWNCKNHLNKKKCTMTVVTKNP